MAKPFRKLVKDYLKNKSTIEYLQVLENQRKGNYPNADNQLFRIVQEGTDLQGTLK
jgi:hypothetical protein